MAGVETGTGLGSQSGDILDPNFSMNVKGPSEDGSSGTTTDTQSTNGELAAVDSTATSQTSLISSTETPKVEDVKSVAEEVTKPGNGDNDNEEGEDSDSSASTDDEFPDRLQDILPYLRRHTHLQTGPNFTNSDKADFFVKSMKAMQWVFEAISKEAVTVPPPSSGETPENRVKALLENRSVNWIDWMETISIPRTGTYPAMMTLRDEPPSLFINQWGRHQWIKNTDVSDLHQEHPSRVKMGLKKLPARICIASRAASRILDSICDDRLNVTTRKLVLLRPFRLLTFNEEKIRKRLQELQDLCKLPDIPKDERIPHAVHAIFRSETDWSNLSLAEREEAAGELGLVVSFIDDYIKPLAKLRVDRIPVYFDEMWHVLLPGTLVYAKDPSVPQKIWRVIQARGGRKPLQVEEAPGSDILTVGGVQKPKVRALLLDCYHLDFNGFIFVRVFHSFLVEPWEGVRAVESLPVLPLAIAEQEGLIKSPDLMERGKQFVSYTKATYGYYQGRTLSKTPTGGYLPRPQHGSADKSVAVVSETVEGAVVVDFERCLRANPEWLPGKFNHERPLAKTADNEVKSRAHQAEAIEDDRVWDARLAEKILDHENNGPIPLRHKVPEGDDLLLLPDRVFGFILRDRRWACLQLGPSDIDPSRKTLDLVTANLDAWKDLQLQGDHRIVIESLMKSHFSRRKSDKRQYDLIKDKGKGLIILLHGVPGVGKTSTAEAVAQFYNKPLLPITCGDLGLSPTDVEMNLQTSFQMAQAWECVLLLDEADVFLAERSRDNIERNALVSVFLRVLEYYEGILFLTTNKIGSFDEAFKSRVSMALYYPPLDLDQTRAIWKAQMRRIQKSSREVAPNDGSQHIIFDEEDINFYAQSLWFNQQHNPQFRPVWNGRQIRNAFQAAIALAEYHRGEGEGIHVQKRHFEKVAAVTNEFNSYLFQTKKNRDDMFLNQHHQWRDDAYVPYSNNTMMPAPTGGGGQVINPQGYAGAGQQSWNSPWPQNTQPMASQTTLMQPMMPMQGQPSTAMGTSTSMGPAASMGMASLLNQQNIQQQQQQLAQGQQMFGTGTYNQQQNYGTPGGAATMTMGQQRPGLHTVAGQIPQQQQPMSPMGQTMPANQGMPTQGFFATGQQQPPAHG